MHAATEAFPDLSIAALRRSYGETSLTPSELMRQLAERIAQTQERGIWITTLPLERLLEQARALERRGIDSLPLYGVPFAIKDNIDLEGQLTTAACPQFAYVARESAHVVARLIEAGALPVGKTNLDQFATGLVGTRSPYGVCRNAFDPEYISGGSSSGSAVAVALGLASFALGSDTAGSGRVPAAFNNLIGLKPTRGRLSPRGLVPACRTLDTVSVFALSAEDGARVCQVAEGFDPTEPYSRSIGYPKRVAPFSREGFRFGVPRPEQLQFFGNEEYPRLFDAAVAQLERLGGQRVLVDFAPFLEAAQLLYAGPWLAERYLVVQSLLRRAPEALHPITRQVIEGGASPSAADLFKARYRLQALRRTAERVWDDIDALMTPTAGTHYRIREVESDPVTLNTRLGFYTNFMNLLDLAAVAVPAGFTSQGLPFGITLAGPAWSDYPLLSLAARLQHCFAPRAGALPRTLPQEPTFDWQALNGGIELAVCGAHLSGLALNHQLTERGAVLLERTHTAACYRLFALPGGPPYRPGLVHAGPSGGSIEVEVWTVPAASFGTLVAAVAAPLAIGKITLASGREVCGFVCEARATLDAQDISAYGGWRAYLARRPPG